MKTPYLLAMAILASGLLTGCSGALDPVDQDPRYVALLDERPQTLPFKAGFATPRIGFDPQERNRGARRRFSFDPEAQALGQVLFETLSKVHAFAAFEPVTGDTLPERVRSAWDAKLDLLIEPEILRWDTVFKGINGWYIPNLLIWFQFLAPSWFLPDEDYAFEATVKLTVRSVHTGRVVGEFVAEAAIEHALNDFERGWQLLGIFRVPGSLSESNWQSVYDELIGEGRRELLLAASEAVVKAMPEAMAQRSFLERMAKRLALVVGVQNYQHHRLPKAVYARSDATTVHTALAPGTGDTLRDQTCLLLAGEAATGKNILAALDDLLARLRRGDELLVYLAGLGALESPESEDVRLEISEQTDPVFVPYDADPNRLAATSINLIDLGRRLSASPARCLVVIDAAFNVQGGQRALAPAVKNELTDDLNLPIGDRLAWLLACAPNQQCGLLDQQNRGLFSFFFTQGLAGKADADDDGAIRFDEIYPFVREEVGVQALVEQGTEQTPLVVGAAAKGFTFTRR